MKTILLSFSFALLVSLAMKSNGPIAVDCSGLNEVIRCASLDTVWASDGTLKETVFNREVYQLQYQVLGSKSISEIVTSRSNAKVYHLEAVHQIKTSAQSIALSNALLSQLRLCLDSWVQNPVKLTTLDRFKLTTPDRLKLTIADRSKLTT